MIKEQLLVSVLLSILVINFWLSLYFVFVNNFDNEKVTLTNFGLVLYFTSSFSFSYVLLIMLNRLGLFTILLTHDDENRVIFSIEPVVSNI